MTSKKKKIILNIIFYAVLGIIYAFTIVSLISKFTGGTLYFFNTRFDVVLTDSMSVRNYHHEDFLKDTTQIQPFDMVVSEKINDDTTIEVKDCVLFKNPKLNNATVVHRVIGVSVEGYQLTISKCAKTSFNSLPMTRLIDDGTIYLASLNVTDVVIEAYSPAEYSQYIVFYLGKEVYETQTATTKISDNVYHHTITFNRPSSAPYSTTIALATDQELYISKVTYTSKTKGNYVYDSNDLVVKEDGSYSHLYDARYLYEIRADKSSASDGVFDRSQILSKVTNIIPKIGHVTHFLQSIPGMIMLVGLAVIITVASYFWNKNINGLGSKPKVETVESDTNQIIDNKEKENESDTETNADTPKKE